MGNIYTILGGIALDIKKKEWILQNLEEMLKHTSSILVIPAEGYFENPAFAISNTEKMKVWNFHG